MRMAGLAAALIVGALIAWWMVDQAKAQPVRGEAGEHPALFLSNESLPPMNFMKDGKPTGIVIDLVEALAKRMHHPVEIRLMNWTEAQQLVLEGRADALLQINPDPERLKIFDFSEPLLTSEFTIFTSAERLGITSMSDLRGLKVGVEEKGLPILLLQKDHRVIVKIVPDFVQAFGMLAKGALDAVIADRWVGSYVLAENNIRGVKLIAEPIGHSESAIAVKKGNAELLGDINAALVEIRRDGTYDRIFNSWRSKEVVFKTREQLRQQTWLISAISVALIVALVSVAALVREIRRRKRVEEALRESEEQLRLFIEHAPASLAMFDRSMRYLSASRRWLADYNLEQTDLTGLSHYEVFPEIPEYWKEVHRRGLAGEVVRADADRFDRADGSVQWLRWEVRPWREAAGDVAGIVIFSEDITERKRAEEMLSESEARFRALVQASSDAVYRMSPDWGQMYQLRGRDFISDTETTSNTWLQKYIHPDDQPLVTATINEAIRNKSIFELEHRVLRVDGSLGWTFSRAIPLQDQNGEIVEWFGAASDITERKQAEEELRRLNRILRALSNTNQAAIHAEDESDFLDTVCRIVVEDCGHPMAWIGFAEDDENKTVRPVAQAGFEDGYLETVKITWSDTELGRGPTGTAIRTGTPDVSKNMLTESRMAPWREQALNRGYACSVALPLITGGQTLGVLTIYSKDPDSFPGHEVKLLAELADDLAYGITVLRLRLAHRQSEQKLRESQARLDLALRSAQMGVWHLDLIENKRHFDDQVCHLLGIAPAGFTGTAEEFYKAVHPDDREMVKAALARTIEQDVPYETEYRTIWPNGSVHYIIARARLFCDETGHPVRVDGLIWDITGRRQAEVLLQRQAEMLHLSYDAIIVWRLGAHIESWNRGAEELYGYSQEEAVGRVTPDLLKTIHPEPWPQIEAKLRERKFWEGELRHRTREGREIIVSARHQLVRGEDGVERILEINRDITERKRAESRLTADLNALTRMHALGERLLVTGGLQPLLQEIMDAAVSIVGAEKGTLQLLEGDSLRIVAHHGHRQPFLQFFASAKNQASVCGEATRRGERVVVSDVETSSLFIGTPSLPVLREAGVRAVQSTPMISRNGALLGIITTQWGVPFTSDEHDLWRIDLLVRQAADLIEHSKAEEALRKSRDELELRVRERTAELVAASEDLQKQAALLNLALDAIFVRGLDHTVKFWNDGAEELYGFSSEEALGKVTQDLLRTEFPEPVDRIADQVLESGRWEGELRQTASTGKEILVESRWALQRGTDGEPLGFLEINRDVTARKLAEEALRSNMARLELVNAELQEFAFVASHDLQEPLRKIQTFCDMARKRCAPVIDSTSQDYLDRVINSASRMRQLLSALLQFSRVATRPEPFKRLDLVKIVREAEDIFEETVKNTGALVEIENMPAIEADETQMLRLFQNLIGNALKFRGEGTPRIKVYGKLDKKRMCEIIVKDNGIGFDPGFAELIFKPFQRLHGRSEYDGTGMGLAICRKIVERHGGSIRAESELGKGSTFIIRLPAKQTAWETIIAGQQS